MSSKGDPTPGASGGITAIPEIKIYFLAEILFKATCEHKQTVSE